MTSFKMLVGRLLVSRSPEDTIHRIKGTDLILFKPDDMGDSAPSWAPKESRIANSGYCHLHESSLQFERQEELNLTGKIVYFEKWTERTFEAGGHTFLVLDEESVLGWSEP